MAEPRKQPISLVGLEILCLLDKDKYYGKDIVEILRLMDIANLADGAVTNTIKVLMELCKQGLITCNHVDGKPLETFTINPSGELIVSTSMTVAKETDYCVLLQKYR